MDMICKGISEEECFRRAVEEYENQLMDKKAVSQAQRRPLWQALQVFKWLHGYGGKRTMQHDKELCETWDKIVMTVKKRYLYWTNEDVNPEILAEMNLYAIDLIKEEIPI